MLKLTNIQNDKLDNLTNIWNTMEYNKRWLNMKISLNQLEKEKEQLRNEMVQKTNLLVFQQYTRREIILIYGIEENKEDKDDGEKVFFKLADELQIDLEDNEIQRVHRLGQ